MKEVIQISPVPGVIGKLFRGFYNYTLKKLQRLPVAITASQVYHTVMNRLILTCFFIALNMASKLFVPDRARIYCTIAMPE